MNKKWIPGISASALLMGLFFSPSAMATPCSDSSSGIFEDAALSINGYSDCMDGPGDGSNGPFSADFDFFGTGDFEALQKFNVGGALETEIDASLLVGSADDWLTGTWSFDAPDGFTDFVIILKGGKLADDPDDIRWSAYLVNDGLFSGFWQFHSLDEKQLSHLSLYGKRGDATTGGQTTGGQTTGTVPEPGTLALLGLGLLGFAFARRRTT